MFLAGSRTVRIPFFISLLARPPSLHRPALEPAGLSTPLASGLVKPLPPSSSTSSAETWKIPAGAAEPPSAPAVSHKQTGFGEAAITSETEQISSGHSPGVGGHPSPSDGVFADVATAYAENAVAGDAAAAAREEDHFATVHPADYSGSGSGQGQRQSWSEPRTSRDTADQRGNADPMDSDTDTGGRADRLGSASTSADAAHPVSRGASRVGGDALAFGGENVALLPSSSSSPAPAAKTDGGGSSPPRTGGVPTTTVRPFPSSRSSTDAVPVLARSQTAATVSAARLPQATTGSVNVVNGDANDGRSSSTAVLALAILDINKGDTVVSSTVESVERPRSGADGSDSGSLMSAAGIPRSPAGSVGMSALDLAESSSSAPDFSALDDGTDDMDTSSAAEASTAQQPQQEDQRTEQQPSPPNAGTAAKTTPTIAPSSREGPSTAAAGVAIPATAIAAVYPATAGPANAVGLTVSSDSEPTLASQGADIGGGDFAAEGLAGGVDSVPGTGRTTPTNRGGASKPKVDKIPRAAAAGGVGAGVGAADPSRFDGMGGYGGFPMSQAGPGMQP